VRASEALQAARGLIEDPQRWCAGTRYIPAVLDQHCALGALYRVATGSPFRQADADVADYLNAAAEVIDPLGGSFSVPSTWLNDTRGHGAVMKAFDVATSMALSDEAGL
jgi:hypothetical protein